MSDPHYHTRTLSHWDELPPQAWDALLEQSAAGQSVAPFMRWAFLRAMQTSQCASDSTGWTLHLVTLWEGEQLMAAAPVYAKTHSYGEYVFDWAWARAYDAHGLAYYPKGLIAPPFSPVPGPRLLARTEAARQALLQALVAKAVEQGWSSLHALFVPEAERQACERAGWMVRETVQFHWHNAQPPWPTFESFLASLKQEKRKKIKQERRKVAEAGLQFTVREGHEISEADWDFFYHCYAQTYLEHGNAPYLSRAFFSEVAQQLPQAWVLFVAHNASGQRVACSLLGLSHDRRVAYGRYWGALARVDALHFEACYYQPLQWCMANGIARFEGGAQGEHKMARALMPTRHHSAHWVAHAQFAQAIGHYLERETQAMDNYQDALHAHTPFKRTDPV